MAKTQYKHSLFISIFQSSNAQDFFSEYTQELRIQYVLQKLIDVPQFRKYTMQAIAEEVGYKDANTFVRVFKNRLDFLLIITLKN